jgi:hypothetical protein
MKFLLIAALIFTSVCYSQITSVRTIFPEKEYTISSKDQQVLINVISKPNTVVKIVVPFETREIFRTGTTIYGNSLTDGTVWISGQTGVRIVNSDNAFRTKALGSRWTLTKISANFWILNGDLYSVELEAYVGDDVTIRAKVDPLATSPLTFTWYKNGIVLQGKTQASLKINGAQISDSGNYKVDVRNDTGYANSEITSLIVR